MKFEDMKGILGYLGVMRIPLKEGAKPVKQHPSLSQVGVR